MPIAQKMIITLKLFLLNIPNRIGLIVEAMTPKADIMPSPKPDTLDGYS